jgi:hypothetical protein
MDYRRLIEGCLAAGLAAVIFVLALPYSRRSTWVPLSSHVTVGPDWQEFHAKIAEPGPYVLFLSIAGPLPLVPVGSQATGGVVYGTPTLAASVSYAIHSGTCRAEGTATVLASGYWTDRRQAYQVVRFVANRTPDLRVTIKPESVQGTRPGDEIGISVEYGSAKREGWQIWSLLAKCAAVLILCWGGFLIRLAIRPA